MFGLQQQIRGIFQCSNQGRIKLSSDVLTRLNSYRQDTDDKLEAGGVLLGRFIKESKDVIVDKVTVPMIRDKRTKTGFLRAEKMHQRIIDREWDKSYSTINYLGEWHSHPEKYPEPSNKDIESWKEKLKTATFSSRYLYFIIVGIKEINIWEGDRRKQKIRRLDTYDE